MFSPLLISIPEAAERLDRTAASLLGEALRRPDDLPLFVQPDPGGWAATPASIAGVVDAPATPPAGAGGTLLFAGPIRLRPDVLREQILRDGTLTSFVADPSLATDLDEAAGAAQQARPQDCHAQSPAAPLPPGQVLYLQPPRRVPIEALLLPLSALTEASTVGGPGGQPAGPSSPPGPHAVQREPRPAEPLVSSAVPPAGLLGYPEAAAFLGVARGTLYNMVHERRIPHVRLSGRMVRFDKGSLERWLASRQVRTR